MGRGLCKLCVWVCGGGGGGRGGGGGGLAVHPIMREDRGQDSSIAEITTL